MLWGFGFSGGFEACLGVLERCLGRVGYRIDDCAGLRRGVLGGGSPLLERGVGSILVSGTRKPIPFGDGFFLGVFPCWRVRLAFRGSFGRIRRLVCGTICRWLGADWNRGSRFRRLVRVLAVRILIASFLPDVYFCRRVRLYFLPRAEGIRVRSCCLLPCF